MDTKDLVVKSNELIEGHYKLSAAAQKIAAALISKVNPDEKSQLPEFHFSIPEYAQFFGISNSVAYRMVHKTTLELKKIVITLRKRNSLSFMHVGLFSYCHYDEDKQTVGFRFEPLMEPHIKDFAQNFTQYQVVYIRNLKSGYSIRLYELLRKVHPMKSKKQQAFYEIKIEELRNILGIYPEQYQRFDGFKHRVLNKAQSDLKDKTDLTFDFEPIRKGRKIGAIKFIIRHNRKMALPEQDADIPALEQTLEDQLKAYFPDNILALVQDEFDSGRIERNLQYVQEQQSLGSVDIKHPGKYLLKAIKEDYAKPPESKSTIDKLLDTSWDVDD